MKYVPKEPPEGINAPRTNPLAELALLAGTLTALLVVAFLGLGVAAEWLAVRVSPRLEVAIGERIPLGRGGMRASGAERQILDRLLAHVPHPGYDVDLRIPCGQRGVNAFAVPGGRLVVLPEVLATVGSENELAFVLAHELGHFRHRDHLRALGRGLVVVTLAAALGSGGDFASRLVMGSGVTVSHQFNQRQELAADAFAVELLQRTYGHPGGTTDFFGHPALAESGSWFGTHPGSGRRVDAIEQLVRERGWTPGPLASYTPAPTLCAE